MNPKVLESIAGGVQAILAFSVVLSVHEASHAAAAYFLGDETAKRMGRLSLNPLVHIDPVGLLALLLFRIGWAKPVMFNHRNFKHPRLYSLLTAYAGPFSNFILTLVVFVCLKVFPFGYVSPVVALVSKKVLPFYCQIECYAWRF